MTVHKAIEICKHCNCRIQWDAEEKQWYHRVGSAEVYLYRACSDKSVKTAEPLKVVRKEKCTVKTVAKRMQL